MISFANKFQTDGVGTSFLFARKTDEDEDAIRETQLGFSDFTVQEVENSFEVVGVDPGRSQVFTASYGCGNDSHQVRRCSSKEYYAMTGSPRRNAKLQKVKSAKRHFRNRKPMSNVQNGKRGSISLISGLVEYTL
jgi:hypothetical protein